MGAGDFTATRGDAASSVVLCKWQPELAAALLRLADRLYVILDAFDVEYMEPDWDLLARAERVYTISEFNSLEELAAVATDLSQRGADPDRIVSYTEFSQFGAGYLEVLLGHGARDLWSHVAVRDKRLMKSRVRAAGIPVAPHVSVPDRAAAEQRAAVRALRFPVVVKPAAGFGTMSTRTVSAPEDLADALDSWRREPYLKGEQLIVEELVEGRELHIDALWDHEDALFFVVSAYHESRLSLQEGRGEEDALDGSFVIRQEDDPSLHERLRELNRSANAALGIDRAVTHLEVFERADGELVFSEIASRVGGGWIPSVLTQALGRDVWAAIAEGLLTGSLPTKDPTHPYLGAIHLRPRRPGRITSMPSDEALAAAPGVLSWQRLRVVGDTVRMENPSDWCTFVVLGAETQSEYHALARRLTDELRVETEPEDEDDDA